MARNLGLLIAILAWATTAGEAYVSLTNPQHANAFVALGHMYSYFTVISCTLTAIVYTAMLANPAGWAGSVPMRAALALYMVMLAIIFHVLLAGGERAGLEIWLNISFHIVLPALVGLDWLIFAPKRGLQYSHALWWLAYPLIYCGISQLRGALGDPYPYFFFDPAVAGVGAVVQWVAILTLAFLLAGFAQIGATRQLAHR